MRATPERQLSMLSSLSTEDLIPGDHPTRRIRKVVDEVLAGLDTDLKGQKRSNKTHTSTTDPDAMLFRKSPNAAAESSYMGHLLIENRSGLVVDTELTQPIGLAERDCATDILARLPTTKRQRAKPRDHPPPSPAEHHQTPLPDTWPHHPSARPRQSATPP
ncbi:MAG: hypothetical protein GY925_12865, partial [Actinomycetia bacterium]|nr:hypothetical protein [Actinomycetes bacterium]